MKIMECREDVYIYTLFLVFLLAVFFHYGKSTYNYWQSLGVVYLKPKYPLFGNLFETTLSIKSTVEVQRQIYNFFKRNRFGGIFHFRNPVLFLKDPELIEHVLIKDFTYFYNRGGEVDMTLDPLSAHLVHLKDAQWKYIRNKLTPTFSSGKLKGMHQQLLDCMDELIRHMRQFKHRPFEAKDTMAKLTTNVIGSCAFGLNVNTFDDPNSELGQIGKQVFKTSFLSKIRLSIRSHFPWLIRLLRWRNLSIKTQNFFTNTIKNTIEHREKNNIQRHDFLHILNELRKQDLCIVQNGNVENSKSQFIFDDKLMAANAFVFFVAGFETTASTLSYALYELALNEDIQEKVYKDLTERTKKYGCEPSFEAIKEMNYLDCLVSETLRKYPPVVEISRTVSKPYRIPASSLVLEKDSMVLIPIYSIHHDCEHYPEPERFVPERFSEENKGTIKKGTYMPFGDGPRICIGLGFARLEIKMALCKILINYKVSLNKKTISPLQYNRKSFLLEAMGGIWIDLKERNVSK